MSSKVDAVDNPVFANHTSAVALSIRPRSIIGDADRSSGETFRKSDHPRPHDGGN